MLYLCTGMGLRERMGETGESTIYKNNDKSPGCEFTNWNAAPSVFQPSVFRFSFFNFFAFAASFKLGDVDGLPETGASVTGSSLLTGVEVPSRLKPGMFWIGIARAEPALLVPIEILLPRRWKFCEAVRFLFGSASGSGVSFLDGGDCGSNVTPGLCGRDPFAMDGVSRDSVSPEPGKATVVGNVVGCDGLCFTTDSRLGLAGTSSWS